MTHQAETKNMALFCDFENIALGVRDANYAQFDIRKVVEKLLVKGSGLACGGECAYCRGRMEGVCGGGRRSHGAAGRPGA